MQAVNAQNAEKKADESTSTAAINANIDFKMVTFSLAGKEYGIDIMNVDGIANASRFTYVPNAAPFVRGVYNLRGDIISIIDLRTMFHLPAERKEDDALESLIILSVGDHVFGVIVDNIDKVVGVSSAAIQPPHPIFGDINVKYIKGIIENSGKLYIILNVEKLFAQKSADDEADTIAPTASTISLDKAIGTTSNFAKPLKSSKQDIADVNSDFIREALFTYKHFTTSAINVDWFRRRYDEWLKIRKANELQLREQADADQYLETFYSRHTAELWAEDYALAIIAAMPKFEGKTIHVWNPGCGKGHETYSLAAALKLKYPEARIKIWANDFDLLAISMAPNMVFKPESVPEWCAPFMTQGRNGLAFNQQIRDAIFFEFHDVLNSTPVPPVDIVFCRDTLSFLALADQTRLASDFIEKTKPKGVLVLGENERMPLEGWHSIGNENISIYLRDS